MKRFGRNQKRRMRDELSNSISANDKLKNQLKQAQSDSYRARGVLEVVRRINPNFPALMEAREIQIHNTEKNTDLYGYRYCTISNRRGYANRMDAYIEGTNPCREIIDERYVNLHKLSVDLNESADFGNCIMVKAQFGNEKACMMLSQEALKYMSVDEIATRLAEHLHEGVHRLNSKNEVL